MSEKPPVYVKTDNPSYVRDTNSNAVINSDMQALMRHRERVKQLKANQSKIDSINNVKEDIDSLRDEMSEIKELLKLALEAKDKN
tara:strand:- start:370 stop:624 length:255 start_codon:yes stop_codon:yes gene_type:complete